MKFQLGLGLDRLIRKALGGATPFVGLLDTYSGAAAAYSVRLLSSTYTGALVEIRRRPGNAVKSFYPDTNNELSLSSEDGAGTSLSSWIGSDDGYIRTWYDQSGNSNNAIQTSAGHQPQIVSSGLVITDNSKPTLYFDGSNYMQSASFFTLMPQPTTHFLVGKITGGLSARHFHDFTSYRQGFYNNPVAMYAGAVLGSGVDVSKQKLVAGLFAPTSEISVNGDIKATGNAGVAGAAGFLRIASYSSQPNNWMIGNIQSLIIYGTDRFTSDRVGIETNINDYYVAYPDTSVSGLLHDYPNASVAYSLRQLTIYNNGYKAPLVEIRRSSDNAVKTFYADDSYELSLTSEDESGTSLTTWIGSDNGYVRTWYDQSGNSLDAINTTASGQPIIINSGSLVLSNSKPTLQSIDVNTSLLTASVNINSERSYFIVAERKGAQFGGYHALILQTSASFFQVYAPTNTLTYYNGAVKTGTSFDLAQQLITVSQEATSGVFRKNAVNMVANVNTPGGAVNRPIQLFKYASNALNGCLSEVIVYNTSQSANVSGIEALINSNYTIY